LYLHLLQWHQWLLQWLLLLLPWRLVERGSP
jgi:hypothetical protein